MLSVGDANSLIFLLLFGCVTLEKYGNAMDLKGA